MLAGVDGPTGTVRPRTEQAAAGQAAPTRRPGRALAIAAVIATASVALFALALRQSLTSPVNADGAANVLQGDALRHGNLLLRGWWTSDVSFYPTELPEYAIVTAIRGLSADVVHLCGALTYTLTVLLAAWLAYGYGARRADRPDRADPADRAGGAGWWGAGLTAGIMLAPSINGGTEVFLENPDHAGTAVPVLLVLLLLDRLARHQAEGHRLEGHRAGRRAVCRRAVGRRAGAGRWLGPVAVGALLAVTQVADELSLAAATIPIAVVCAARPLVPAIRPGGGAGSAASPWRDLPLLAAALLSVPVARLAQTAITALGGFHQRLIPGGLLAPLSQAPRGAAVLGQSIMVIFGANTPGSPHRPLLVARHIPLVAMADLHIIGLLLAAAGLAAGLTALRPGRSDRVTQVLVTAIAAVLAAGVFSPVLRQLSNAHEVAILLPLAAVLAGRTLPDLARAARAARPVRRWPRRLAAAALAAWLVLGLAEMGYAATWPEAAAPGQAVTAWLLAHHERDGLAAYWQADATTVTSGGRVLVAPVTSSAAAPRLWETSTAWYDPARHDATFVIAVADPAAGSAGGLTAATVRARFGPPAGEYPVGGDIVLTYRYNLLTRLSKGVIAR
jgi:hypothetical protein